MPVALAGSVPSACTADRSAVVGPPAQTLRVTPAMEAGITDHVWKIDELVGLLEAKERAAIGTAENKRGPYSKSQISD